MRRPGKTVRSQRRKTLRHRNAPKVARRRKPSIGDATKRILQLEHRLNEALAQQTATADVLKVISGSAFELSTVLNTLVESAMRLCEAEAATIWRPDGNVFKLAALHSFSREFEEYAKQNPITPGRGTVTARVALEGRIVHIPDVLTDPEYGNEYIKRGNFRTALGVPLSREGETIGVFVLTRTDVRPYTEKQIELVKTFAAQAVIAIENTRLLNELRESLQQQTATADVLKVISGSPGTLDPVFSTMLAKATELCEASYGTLWLHEGDGYRAVAMHGDLPPVWIEQWRSGAIYRPGPDRPMARAAEGRQPIQIADMRTDPSYLQSDPLPVAGVEIAGIRTLLLVPMFKESEHVGLISIYRTEVLPFTEKQIDLVKNFAAQAVIAIESTRLLNELRESLQQQTATADVLKVISRSTFDLKAVLNTLVESATRLCEADNGNIARPQGNDLYQVEACYGMSAALTDELIRKPLKAGKGSLIGRTALNRATVHIVDVQKDRDYQHHAALKIGGYRTMLGVPLLREGHLVGVFGLARETVRPFTDKQIELVTTFADQAVIAIENARLLNELRQRTNDLSESLEQQTATSEVLKIVSSSSGKLEPVFQAMLANATRICDAAFGSMLLLEGDGFRRVALHNAPPLFVEFNERNPVIPLGQVRDLILLLETRRPVHIADAAGTADSPIVKYGGARTLVIVPMLKKSEVVGAIGIYRQEVRPFTDKQIELVTNFAAQAVIAIENTRLLNELRQRTDDLSESLEQQTATSEVLRVISSSAGELEPVFQTLLGNATRLCMADFGFMFQHKDGFFQLMAQRGADPAYVAYMQREPLRPGPETLLGRIAKSISPVQIADFASSQAYHDRDPLAVVAVESAGVRTLFGVPMLREGELIGAVAVYRQEVRPFTDKQIELLTNFASQAVIAIENARLLNELRESLQQQTATADVLKVISASPGELQSVFHAMLENAVRFCEAKFAQLFLYDQETNHFRAVGTLDLPRAWAEYLGENPIPAYPRIPLGRAATTRQPVHIADIRKDAAFIEGFAPLVKFVELGGARTLLIMPMLKENDLVGAIAIYRQEVRPFTEKQIELVQNFAAQGVIAIENARLLNELRERTHELGASLDNLRTTQDRLVQTQKLASLGQLTAGIAHEIKNPLNFVNNFSGVSAELIDELQEALKEVNPNEEKRAEIKELTDTLRGNLDKIVQHGRRADTIVKNMLLHSREGSGEHRVVDINTIVEESLNLAYHGARAEKQGFEVTLERSFDPGAGKADVFPQDITRVLLNLIANGFYAANRRRAEVNRGAYEPTLTAATKNLGDRVEITIRDNGTGIPLEVKEKMFNPFFTTKPAGEGTGLGLSISHDIIVKQHAGTIEVNTKPGEFTEIRVILPRTAAFV
jgi:GAF domain-containing protein